MFIIKIQMCNVIFLKCNIVYSNNNKTLIHHKIVTKFLNFALDVN